MKTMCPPGYTMALRQLMHLGNLTLKKDEIEVAALSWL